LYFRVKPLENLGTTYFSVKPFLKRVVLKRVVLKRVVLKRVEPLPISQLMLYSSIKSIKFSFLRKNYF